MASKKRKKSKQKNKQATSRGGTEVSLSFSSEQGRLEFLRQQHKKLLTQVKRRRTELANLTTQMREIATDLFSRSSSFHERLRNIDEEIHSLFEEIFKKRGLGKRSKKKVQDLYKRLQLMGCISPRADLFAEDEMEKDGEEGFPFPDDFATEEGERWQAGVGFGQKDEVFNKGRSSADTRKLFLRLAEKFHPDKVEDEETRYHYTEVMKEINVAYKSGDYARLLEIEKEHELGDFKASSKTNQELQEQQLEREVNALSQQLEQLKAEIRQVRGTPEGSLVKDYRRGKREGIDLIDAALEQAEEEVEALEEVRDFVRDFRDRKLTVKEFLDGPASSQALTEEEMLQEALEQMFGDLDVVVRF